MKRLLIFIIYFIICFGYSITIADNVITNGGFEMSPFDTTRPPYWYIGFEDSPIEYMTNGAWSLDTLFKTEGSQSIKLMPLSDEDYSMSQVLNAPTYDLSGKTVRISCDIRTQDLQSSPMVIILAVNPELPPDPDLGTGIAGEAVIVADSSNEAFETYQAEFTAIDNASFILLVCTTTGTSGAVWFDNISVEMDVTEPGSDPEPIPAPIASRSFDLGFVQENPINISEKGWEDVIIRAASASELVNIFFHVRWCELTGEDIEYGHRLRLHQAELAKTMGMKVALTLDFTHENSGSIGDILPTPDGTPVGSLNDTIVKDAYVKELIELCSIVLPDYVIVGIEASIFYEKHPEQWSAYVDMFKEIADSLKIIYPDIHVTSYFTLPWMVQNNGAINWSHAAVWLQLLPQLGSIAYSTYPEVMDLSGVDLAPGYFVKPAEIAPDLPIILLEFGVPGGPDAQISFEDQEQYLERIFQELATVDVELVCWFSIYDQSYLGYPEYLATAFSHIGMHTQDGTPKPVWALWQSVYELNKTYVDDQSISDNSASNKLTLYSNYPNPFNSTTTISYYLPNKSWVNLSVYNILGQLIESLVNEYQDQGYYKVTWYADDYSSGLYLCKISVGNLIEVKKCLLIK